MTLKNTLLSTAATFALALAANAQTDSMSTDTGTDTDMAVESEMPETGSMTGTEAEMEDGTDLATDDMIDTDTQMATDEMNDGELSNSISLAGTTVDEIIGMNVVSAETGETVGEIDYIVQSGDGYQGIIGIGGFLGLGEYTVAIPLEQFDVSVETDNELMLNATEDELRALPEVDESVLDGLPGDHVIM